MPVTDQTGRWDDFMRDSLRFDESRRQDRGRPGGESDGDEQHQQQRREARKRDAAVLDETFAKGVGGAARMMMMMMKAMGETMLMSIG